MLESSNSVTLQKRVTLESMSLSITKWHKAVYSSFDSFRCLICLLDVLLCFFFFFCFFVMHWSLKNIVNTACISKFLIVQSHFWGRPEEKNSFSVLCCFLFFISPFSSSVASWKIQPSTKQIWAVQESRVQRRYSGG